MVEGRVCTQNLKTTGEQKGFKIGWARAAQVAITSHRYSSHCLKAPREVTSVFDHSPVHQFPRPRGVPLRLLTAVTLSSTILSSTGVMPHCLSTICSPFVGRLGQTASKRESQPLRHARFFSPTMSINLQVNSAQGHQTIQCVYTQPQRRFASQRV